MPLCLPIYNSSMTSSPIRSPTSFYTNYSAFGASSTSPEAPLRLSPSPTQLLVNTSGAISPLSVDDDLSDSSVEVNYILAPQTVTRMLSECACGDGEVVEETQSGAVYSSTATEMAFGPRVFGNMEIGIRCFFRKKFVIDCFVICF